MKTNKKVILSILTIALLGSSFTSAFALTTKGATNVEFDFAAKEKVTITYFVPAPSAENDYLTFEEKSLKAYEGDSLSSLGFEFNSISGGFSFDSWNTSDDFANETKLSNDATVSGNMTLYAKFTRSNVLYFYNEAHNYLTASSGDEILTQQNYYVGVQTYGKYGVEGEAIDLTSESGIYKFTLNEGNWSCARKLTISIKDVTWWDSDGAVSKLWCFGSSSLADAYTDAFTFTDNASTVYIDASFTGFTFDRLNPGDLTQRWNQTIDISLNSDSGSKKYTKDSIIIYVNGETVEGKNKYYY